MPANIKIGDIIEGCDLHIGVVVEVDYKSDHVRHKSFFDNATHTCSLNHCGVFVVPVDEVEMKRRVFKEDGMAGITRLWDEYQIELDKNNG